MTILELFRKVFGCYHDDTLDIEEVEIPESHVIDMSSSIKLCRDIVDKLQAEQNEVIGNIVSAVINEKEKEFVSYTEEAMDEVTGGKFKFKKYRK